MYKKLAITTLLSVSILASVGCGKKTDMPAAPQDNAPAADTSAPMPADAAPAMPEPQVSNDANKDEVGAIINNVRAKFPRIEISKVSRAPVPNFYQLQAGGDVLYVSAQGDRMFVGDLIGIDGPEQTNLTEQVRKDSRLSVLNTLSEDDMIVYNPKGKPEYTVTVFTDVDCGYCRKFHKEMNDYLA